MPLVLKILHGSEDEDNVTSLTSHFSIFYGFLSSGHIPNDRFRMPRSPASSDDDAFTLFPQNELPGTGLLATGANSELFLHFTPNSLQA